MIERLRFVTPKICDQYVPVLVSTSIVDKSKIHYFAIRHFQKKTKHWPFITVYMPRAPIFFDFRGGEINFFGLVSDVGYEEVIAKLRD